LRYCVISGARSFIPPRTVTLPYWFGKRDLALFVANRAVGRIRNNASLMLFCRRVEFWLLTGGRLMGDPELEHSG